MSRAVDFTLGWNEERNMATARVQFGDVEVAAHCHVRPNGQPVTDSIAFQRNSGATDRPFMDFGTHLPAGGYRRLAAMLNALADEVDADAARRANLALPGTEGAAAP